jgi:guanosine-3',5'-bis(diphosphate) 3'-pyrophosphohydrolase
MTSLVLRAADFAAEKHSKQRRKDGKDTPYINHPLNVAHLLAQVGGVEDPDILAAALLHDTVEDTDATLEEVTREFGAHIAGIVAEVTDDKSLPKSERKRLQIRNAPHKSRGAKLVKLADKLSNLTDLQTSQPKSWSVERVQGYCAWASLVVDGLSGTNEALETQIKECLLSQFNRGGTNYPCCPALNNLEAALETYLASL